MDLKLNGRVALVTGGGLGVGRMISLRLAEEGAKVAVNDIVPERAEAVVAEIVAAGGTAYAAVCDITDLEKVRQMAATVAERLGPVDILVNNAGIVPERRSGELRMPTFAEMPTEFWNKIVGLNYFGVMNCVSAVIDGMIDRKYGKILSIISDAGRVGEPGMAVYSGAKAAILGFSKALAKEVGKQSINVNTVALSAVSHEAPIAGFQKQGLTVEENETLGKVLRNYPIGQGLGRLTYPEDVADAVAFAVSDRAAYITGQCIAVNGGFAMV